MNKSLLLFFIINLYFSFYTKAQDLQLQVTGNNEIETKIIDSVSYNKYHKDFSSIKAEVDSLKNKFLRIGYLNSFIQNINKENDSVFNATLYLKKKYNNLHIKYDENITPKSILKSITKNIDDGYFVIPIEATEETLSHINLKLSENGQPFNRIKLSNIIINKDNVEASLFVSEKQKTRTIDKIIVKGYERFPKSYLKYFFKIKTEDIFNLSAIKKKTLKFENLKFANQLKDPEVLFTEDSTTLYLYIDKIKSNSFDGFLGFGTNEETSKLEFNGYLNLSLLNNLNYGERLNIIYKSDENDQKTFNANINIPYLFGSPIGTEAELNIFKKDSTFSTVNQNIYINYQLNTKNKLSLGVNTTQSENLLSEQNSIASIKDYSKTLYSLRYEYIKIKSNNRLFPVKSLFDIEVGTGKREFERISENQTQVSFNTFNIFELNSKNSAYIRLNGFNLFSNTFLENELIRFGGINSIRGFEENSLTASLFGLINTEYRYTLSNSIYIHSIIDFSYFENKLINQKEKLYGFGLGFGILTKAGLLKFNYANGKSENQKFKLSNSQIHLSLSAVF
ncbi:membrane protein [Corallibacter vietnamensis]|uniref:Membrane protein n=1 Tax=Corallibacter vietnamensis TaxID=904130 RepID=A0ABP7GP91_9FLAO